MAEELKTQSSDILKTTLDENGLPDIYNNLTKQGFTFDYLSACSSEDVEDLCSVLNITELLQKLKFKRCLSALAIPKPSQPRMVYSVVTESEQQCLCCIERNLHSLKTQTHPPPPRATDTRHMEQHNRVINDTFDALIAALNTQRNDSLRAVDSLWQQYTQHSRMLPTCLRELQHIETQCRQLLQCPASTASNRQTRETRMRKLLHAWLSKYEHLQLARDIEVKTVDIEQCIRSFADIVSVRPQQTCVIQSLRSMATTATTHDKPSINGLAYDASQIDAIEVPAAMVPSSQVVAPSSSSSWSFVGNDAWSFVESQSSSSQKKQQEMVEQAEHDCGWRFELKEQGVHVANGHEHETLLQSIAFKRLYVFDATSGWKERATDSVIGFYECRRTHKIRIVAREQQTRVVRLNHWVPLSSSHCARLCTKRCDVLLWNAMDDSIDDDNVAAAAMRVFCVRFAGNECGAYAQQFKKVFEFARLQNETIHCHMPLPARIQFDPVATTVIETTSNNTNNDDHGNGGTAGAAPNASESPFVWNFCAPSTMTKTTNETANEATNDDVGVFSFTWTPSSAHVNVAPNDANQQSLFFADDNNDNRFGEYMENIRNFTNEDDKQQAEERVLDNHDEDNVRCITFEPIVSLPEVEVCTGHEQETKLQSFKVRTLYRWGQDVCGAWGWKERATVTFLEFYRNEESKQLRLVCREHATNKLRLNQWVNVEVADMQSSSPLTVKWKAMDATLAKEDCDSRNVLGYAMFAARFYDEHTVDAFMDLYQHCEQEKKESAQQQ